MLILTDENVHLACDLSLDLQLLHIGYISDEGILSEEVSDEDLLHIGALVESRVVGFVRMH